MTSQTDLRTDPDRELPDDTLGASTGIYVRARRTSTGRPDSVDIVELDTASLDAWLRGRDNIEWPIGVVMVLLGHPQREAGR